MSRQRLRDLGIAYGTLRPGPGTRSPTSRACGSVFPPWCVTSRAQCARASPRSGARRRDLTDAVFAGTTFVQRQRRNDRAALDRRAGAGRGADLHHQHLFGRRGADAVCALAVREGAPQAFHLPVVAETYDGWLSDCASFPVTAEHAFTALDRQRPDRLQKAMSAAGPA